MKIIHPSVLLPILLGGCSLSHQKQNDVDARQFVDGQISTQLQRIALAQQNLQQASRTATPKTPPVAKPVSVATNSAPASSTTGTLRGLSAIKTLGIPEPYTVVNLNARNLKLDAMLRAIIPQGWTPVISADLTRKFTSTLSMTANDQWPYVLEQLLQQHGLVALIDWPKKQVTVAYRTPAFSASTPAASSPLPRPELNKATVPSSGTKTPAAPAAPRNPFSGSRGAVDKAAPASSPGKTLSSAPTMSKVAPAPKLVPVPKTWRIDAGNTLKDALFNWAASEKCTTPGVNNWTIAWLTPVNYRVDAPLQFKGDFRSALNGLFTLYGNAKVPLYAGVRSTQCVISVDDKEIR